MEQVANNPAMMQAATEQMKNMSESDLQQAMRMGVGGGGMATTPQAPSTGSDGGSPLDNISSDQFRQATMSMDPSVLKANAAAMKGMSADEIRRRNPQMANFTDAQITQSIAQMEMMAQNPEMMKVVQQVRREVDGKAVAWFVHTFDPILLDFVDTIWPDLTNPNSQLWCWYVNLLPRIRLLGVKLLSNGYKIRQNNSKCKT